MRGAWRGAAIAAITLFAGLTGCGGSRSGASSNASAQEPPVAGEAAAHGAALTKQEWVDRANEACDHLIDKKTRKTEAFYKARGVHGTPNLHQREAMNAAVVLANVQERIEAMEALPVPPGEGAKIHAILRSMERGIHEAEAHPENLAKPKQPIPFAESEHLGGAYGLVFCGMP